jgi:hypothetical protein
VTKVGRTNLQSAARGINHPLSFRDAPLGAGPESILTIVVMDSGFVLRTPRNDGGENYVSPPAPAMISCSVATWRAKAPRPVAVAVTVVCGFLPTKAFSTAT